MKIHPLFAGFKGENLHAVSSALGFAAHVETFRGDLPDSLPAVQVLRMQPGGDLHGFFYAGGWGAPGVHCLFFVKPLTALASTCWLAGLGVHIDGLRPSYLHTGASVLADLQTAGFVAFGEMLDGWPRVVPDEAAVFAEAYGLVLDGFAVQTGNVPARTFKTEPFRYAYDAAG